MGYGDDQGTGPRKMYDAVCADCGQQCKVPFEPKDDRPVYCLNCLPKHRKKRF